jgi:hypothetical protein
LGTEKFFAKKSLNEEKNPTQKFPVSHTTRDDLWSKVQFTFYIDSKLPRIFFPFSVPLAHRRTRWSLS